MQIRRHLPVAVLTGTALALSVTAPAFAAFREATGAVLNAGRPPRSPAPIWSR
ncbi:hypothetical protein ACFY36_18605 [Actinoplanes sp. NPDC000266]